MFQSWLRLSVVFATLALSSCSEERSLFSERYNFSGPKSLLDPGFESLSDDALCQIIQESYPGGNPNACTSNQGNATAYPSQKTDAAAQSFQQAYAAADNTAKIGADKGKPTFPPDRKDYDTQFYVARNTIQDRILAASEQRCSAYKKYLRHLDGSESFAFGALATILGGAGAIVTSASGARALAGSAGIMSGLSAEAKAQIFDNLATSVIAPGIDKARHDIVQDIMTKRCHSVATYTLELAIRDAVYFHGACTMDAGINAAAATLQATKDPGLNSVSTSLDAVIAIQQKAVTIATGAKVPKSGGQNQGQQGNSGAADGGEPAGDANKPAAQVDSATTGKTDPTNNDGAGPSTPKTITFAGVDIPVYCGAEPAKPPTDATAPTVQQPAVKKSPWAFTFTVTDEENAEEVAAAIAEQFNKDKVVVGASAAAIMNVVTFTSTTATLELDKQQNFHAAKDGDETTDRAEADTAKLKLTITGTDFRPGDHVRITGKYAPKPKTQSGA